MKIVASLTMAGCRQWLDWLNGFAMHAGFWLAENDEQLAFAYVGKINSFSERELSEGGKEVPGNRYCVIPT